MPLLFNKTEIKIISKLYKVGKEHSFWCNGIVVSGRHGNKQGKVSHCTIGRQLSPNLKEAVSLGVVYSLVAFSALA